MDPRTNCPILKLPRELRDMIYAELFDGLEINAYQSEYAPPPPGSPFLRTCRLINEEAIEIYYKHATLHFDSIGWALSSLSVRPQQAAMVRRIVFIITDEHCEEVLSRRAFAEVLDRSCTFVSMNKILRRELAKKLKNDGVRMHAELCLEFIIPEWEEYWMED